jgi:hypothetical protein
MLCHHIYFIGLITVVPHDDKYHMYITDRSFYGLNCIWLQSYETAVYIDCFLRYFTSRGLLLSTRMEESRQTRILYCKYV